MSVSPHVSARLLLEGFLSNLILGAFMKICLQIGQKIKHFTSILRYLLLLTATINLFKRALFQWNGINVSIAGEVKTWRERLRYVYVARLVRATETTYTKKFSMSDKRFTQFYCRSSLQHRSICSVGNLWSVIVPSSDKLLRMSLLTLQFQKCRQVQCYYPWPMCLYHVPYITHPI